MSVNTIDNTSRIQIDIQRKSNLALRFMLEGIDRTASPKTPKDTGILRNSPQKQVLGTTGTITWPQKYAQPQEAGVIHGSRVRNYTTPGTGPHFAENAVAKEAVDNAAMYFKKAGLI